MRSAATACLLLALLTLTAGVPALPEPAKPSALLAELAFEGGTPESPCPGAAATRTYEVVALRIPISYNHWGDVDPEGRLFVLAEDEQEVLLQVAQSLVDAGLATQERLAAAAASNPLTVVTELGVNFQSPTSLGRFPRLDPVDASPLVQPLVVRARVGECVVFSLTNKLPEPVSIHVHRAVARPGQGMSFASEDSDLTLPGETRDYVVFIPDLPGMEGAHYLHSHADQRFHTRHGLFGALVAEPADADWLGPDGQPANRGQAAIITRPGHADFREFVIILHDEVELLDRSLNPLPIVSPYDDYGPGTKGINLRTEPFMDRFLLHDELHHTLGDDGEPLEPRPHDKSQGYGSYTYGDPAHFIPEAYVGDPTKIRLINAGPGQHHVFHLHGGGDRWRASPVSDDTQFDAGLLKVNPVVQAPSERLDVQNVGPGESYNLEIEGGAGGVQQSVGDFLYHCHIVEHYVAGMWAFWRVYNTLQPGLAELPDRAGRTPQAVDSAGLVGRAMPDGTVLDEAGVRAWVEAQLPPQGVPHDDDASVWDWAVEDTSGGPRYLGEPEDTYAWPNYASPTPGERPVLQFHPGNGRLAYPFLSPHFGKRPPMAPDHGPSPYLGPDGGPGRPDGLCPPGSRLLTYNVVALSVPVAFNARDVDPDGQIFVHAEDKAAVQAGAKEARNLVLRANVGDCVDVVLTSQLDETPANGDHSKVNMHIHLVQFDVQASDGVISGRNYEQSVRPARGASEELDHQVPTVAQARGLVSAGNGQTVLRVGSVAPFLDASDPPRPKLGTLVGVGLTEPTLELAPLVAVDEAAGTITLGQELAPGHDLDAEYVGYEYVRYRWYADVELGMVYWHDHVNGLESWRHGLFGGLVVEPAGSAWRDPRTGQEVREGVAVDIVGPRGTYREVVLQFQDRSWDIGGRDLASFNLRSAPFDGRPGNPLDSAAHGDPETLVEAYVGDPVVIRFLYAANANTRSVGTFGITGHRFPYEQHNPGSRILDAFSTGISAQHNLRLECGAGGCAGLPGDYLYSMTQPDLFRRGAWGILRVHGALQEGLLPLPTNPDPQPGALPQGPERRYDLVALESTVAYNEDFGIAAPTKLLALASQEAAIRSGALRPMPLVLRALPGETLVVNVTNRLAEPLTLHAGLLLADPADGSLGVPVGRNPDPAIAPGATRTFRWHADRELGAAYLTSFADPAEHGLDGLHGAVVVEPAGSRFDNASGMSATLTLADGTRAREHVLLYSSDDPVFESSVMPYTVDVQGIVGVNYRTEPLHERLGGQVVTEPGRDPVGGMGLHACQLNNDTCTLSVAPKEIRVDARHPAAALVFSTLLFGASETPRLDAREGQALVIRALGGAGDQLQVHSVAGHVWRRDPGMPGSDLVDAVTLGPREVSNAWMTAGPGGPGDYLWGSHRAPFLEAGAWGVLRVT